MFHHANRSENKHQFSTACKGKQSSNNPNTIKPDTLLQGKAPTEGTCYDGLNCQWWQEVQKCRDLILAGSGYDDQVSLIACLLLRWCTSQLNTRAIVT